MAQLFQRAVRVTLGATVIADLRVQFKIKQSLTKEPNTLQLSIFNLSAETRGKMQSKGVQIIVEAGYADTIAQIFKGTSTVIDHVHEGPDWITKVQCGDGVIPFNVNVHGSFKKGTPVSTVFEDIAKKTGLDVSGAVSRVRSAVSEQFTKGHTAFGKAGNVLDDLVNGRGLEWSIQDGRMQVLPFGGTTSDSAVVLSPTTGLIGSPAHGTAEKEKKASLLVAKSLLQPSLRPGRAVRVENVADAKANGDFRVVTSTHDGDTAGGAWWSECELAPLS